MFGSEAQIQRTQTAAEACRGGGVRVEPGWETQLPCIHRDWVPVYHAGQSPRFDMVSLPRNP